LLLLASFEQVLQHALDRFSAGYFQVGMKISTKKRGVLSLQKPKSVCMLQLNDNTLQHVEEFKSLVVIMEFTSHERRNKETDPLIVKAYALLRELHRSVVTKQEFPNTAELLVFEIVLCSGPHLWS